MAALAAPLPVCTETHAHPHRGLHTTLVLPSYVRSLTALTHNEFGERIGAGWEWEAVIQAQGQSGTLDEGAHDHTSQCDSCSDDELAGLGDQACAHETAVTQYEGEHRIRISVGADFPDSPPYFRFASLVEHVNITDLGLLVPARHWAERLQWTSTSTLLDVLRVCALALSEPYFPIPASDEDIVEDWAFHHAHPCPCVSAECFPVSYPEFEAMTEPEQHQAIAVFKSRLASTYAEQQSHAVRRNLERQHVARMWARATGFPELYDASVGWQADWFAPSFLHAIHSGSEEALRQIVTVESDGIISFDVFSPRFCRMFVRDLHLYETSSLPKYRPNSMNNYGVVVNDIGMEGMISALVRQYMQPIARLFFAQTTAGQPLDAHHSFVVEYRTGHDTNLDMHSDDSDVTVNINLCDEFVGSGLSFCGLHGAVDRRQLSHQYTHRLGRAVMHAGLHRHGADDLESGERLNLIVWCRSSRFRQSSGYMSRFEQPTLTEYEPDLRCLSRTHDSDYRFWLDQLHADTGLLDEAAQPAVRDV